ncbi:Membrane protein implicated in regulation of membrane protease activity [Eubacterium ruminantium]|nr:Membrane protein implicated in regulation of membrane protease activity [Eubacterium ruminantium]
MDMVFNPATWFIAAAVFIVIEILTLGLTTVWFAGGSVGAAIAAAFGSPEWLQVVIFMVVSVAMILVLRPIAKKRFNTNVVATNAQSLIGKQVKILKLTDQEGIAVTRINDVEWRVAYQGTVNVGDELTVEEISGTKLVCGR